MNSMAQWWSWPAKLVVITSALQMERGLGIFGKKKEKYTKEGPKFQVVFVQKATQVHRQG
jgi:hypothetical protein